MAKKVLRLTLDLKVTQEQLDLRVTKETLEQLDPKGTLGQLGSRVIRLVIQVPKEILGQPGLKVTQDPRETLVIEDPRETLR